jgi:replicative superfamily II helicase
MEKKFVVLTKEEFEDILGSFEVVDLPKCKEYVYAMGTKNENVDVRVYSTVDIRTNQTRDKGADAIRVVFWDNLNDRPLGKGKKILRVEGATTIQERIKNRVAEFMATAHDQDIVDFEYVKAVLSSKAVSWMGFAKSLLEGLVQYGSLTDNQLAYVLGDKNPKGKPTMEAQVKIKDPNFMEKYLESLEEEVVEDGKEELEPNEAGKEKAEPEEEKPAAEKANENVQVVPNADDRIPTSKYEDWEYPFDNFNPVQSTVMPHRKEDKNMVIGANTSAGKTICAELLMDDVLKHDRRVVYLSPLKALTNEKYEDWQVRFPNESITIMTGDYQLSAKKRDELVKSRVIVMTSEMMDSRTRKYHSEKNYWMEQVGLVIVDESHILTTERGHAVESGIMRFTKLNPTAKVLFLSATMPNVEELGSWLSDLNGKETTVVYSTWRPVELQKEFIEYHLTYNKWGREEYWPSQDRKRQLVVDTVMAKPDEKFLVFVHDKSTGRNLVNRFEDEGIVAHFHSADLNQKERLEIEGKFQDKTNGIKVLVSTSTLAWGRNLPARNVVICGIHRGINKVDELDIIQMAGRAGRYGIDDAGFVYVIIPEGSTGKWEYIFDNPRPVLSVLNKREIVAFHALSEIETKTINSSKEILTWYSRSLAYKQGDLFDIEDAKELATDLENMEMINDHFHITGLGRVSAWMYFSPYDVDAWHVNFNTILDHADLDDAMICWAIGDVPSNDMGYIPKQLDEDVRQMRYLVTQKGISNPSCAIVSALALYSKIIGDDKCEPYLKPFKRSASFDVARQVQAIALIDTMYADWNQKDLWEILPTRIQYGIPSEMIALVKIKGIGAVKAKKLWGAGIQNPQMVIDAPTKIMEKLFNPGMAKKIIAAAKEV